MMPSVGDPISGTMVVFTCPTQLDTVLVRWSCVEEGIGKPFQYKCQESYVERQVCRNTDMMYEADSLERLKTSNKENMQLI